MIFSIQFTRTRVARLSTIALLAGAWGVFPPALHAADEPQAQTKPAATQRSFATPEEAVKALQTAAEGRDEAAFGEIFGPDYQGLLTGDKVQDTNNALRFASAITKGCLPVKESDDKITLEVGTNNWPLPIPLIKIFGQWQFDTAAGREEIIDRHIGKDELHAISVCRAYVVAQKQYADMIPKVGGGANYAQKFKSRPGKKDGLYWAATGDEPASPFGPMVAQAHDEGYVNDKDKGAGPHPFHGYLFRILTRQGKDAPDGKIDYVSEGVLAGGFALVAYPEQWDQSGIMTFTVNQDGKVYQRNFGEKTTAIAQAMKEYNPDSEWVLVKDDGVLNVVSEK